MDGGGGPTEGCQRKLRRARETGVFPVQEAGAYARVSGGARSRAWTRSVALGKRRMCWEGPVSPGDPQSQQEAGRSAWSLRKQAGWCTSGAQSRWRAACKGQTGTRWPRGLCAPTRSLSAAAGPTRRLRLRAAVPQRCFTRTVYAHNLRHKVVLPTLQTRQLNLDNTVTRPVGARIKTQASRPSGLA